MLCDGNYLSQATRLARQERVKKQREKREKRKREKWEAIKLAFKKARNKI